MVLRSFLGWLKGEGAEKQPPAGPPPPPIDSTDKGHWVWGDSGVGYFGRGTRPGRTGEWALSWQCY